jgi:putative membrane protein
MAMSAPGPRRPVLIDLDEPLPSPAEAPPVPEAGGPAEGAALARVAAVTAGGGGGGRGGWLLASLGAFLGFVASVALWDFVVALVQRSPVLGGIAAALGLGAGLVLAVTAMAEWRATRRLRRVEALRETMAPAAAGTLAEARAAVAAVLRLYAPRADLAWARDRLGGRLAEVLDADALVRLAEAELMAPLDARAEAEVEAAARRVALATALIPMALVDVGVALWANLRMVRRIAEIYGGRSGLFGSWRLVRRVFAHLLATGALALTDDLLGPLAGGGVLARLSRRFGEGLVNGALTARVGVAAMELCRPMPFAARPRPRVSALVGRALGGLVAGGGGGTAAGGSGQG